VTIALPTITFLSCSEADGPTNVLADSPKIDELSVEPSSIHFSGLDGVRDTVITFELSAISALTDDERLVATLISLQDRETLDSDTLTKHASKPDTYQGDLVLESPIHDIQDLLIYVHPYSPDQLVGDRFETRIEVVWEDIGSPEILAVHHPDTITIPAAGESAFFVSAEVTHPFSIDFIEQVRLELFDEDDNFISEYAMADQNTDFGNVSGDSTYVQIFSVNPTNSPQKYSVEVHAINILGTRSDTLRSHFEFVE